MSESEPRFKRLSRAAGPAVGAVCATCLIGLAVWWQFSLRPSLAETKKNFAAGRSVIVLAELQQKYHKGHGVYADGWEPLASVAKDPKAVKRTLKATVDLDTLLVKGGDKFRIEANALGERRRLIRFRGPHRAP